MSTSRKQKKARKPRESDMLSDIENLDILLAGITETEREESEPSNFGTRPDSPCYDASMNQNTNSHSNSREAEVRTYDQNRNQSVREADSSSEFNRLSGELNQRITQELGDFLSTVSSQIQKAINEATSYQPLPQIQATLRSGQGQMPERRWEAPVRGQGYRSEEALNRRFRSNSRDEFPRVSNRNEDLESRSFYRISSRSFSKTKEPTIAVVFKDRRRPPNCHFV